MNTDPREVASPVSSLRPSFEPFLLMKSQPLCNLKRGAVSRARLFARVPNHPCCPSCAWGKAPWAQERRKTIEANEKLKPHAEPSRCALGRWLVAASYLLRAAGS